MTLHGLSQGSQGHLNSEVTHFQSPMPRCLKLIKKNSKVICETSDIYSLIIMYFDNLF